MDSGSHKLNADNVVQSCSDSGGRLQKPALDAPVRVWLFEMLRAGSLFF